MNFRCSIAILVILFSFICSGCDELSSKTEYSLLQEVEYSHRESAISGVQLKNIGNYSVAGFRADSGKKNVWVLLNAEHAPYYKQVPQSRFSLTIMELEKIRETTDVSSTVLAVLETRIRSN